MAQYIQKFEEGGKKKTIEEALDKTIELPKKSESETKSESEKTNSETKLETKSESETKSSSTSETTNSVQTESTTPKKKKKNKPRLFTYRGKEYDLDAYIADLEYNIESWLKTRNIKNKEIVYEAYRDMLLAYNNGFLTPEVGDRSKYMTDMRFDTSGQNNPYRIAQNFFHTILQYQTPYEEPKKENFDISKTSSKVNQILFGTPDFKGHVKNAYLNLDEYKKDKRGTTNRVKAYYDALSKFRQRVYDEDEFPDLDDDERADYLSQLDSALEALRSDWRIDPNEQLKLAKLGVDLEDLFFTGEAYPSDSATDNTTAATDTTANNTQPETPKTPLEQEQARAQEIIQNQQTQILKLQNDWMSLPQSKLNMSLPSYGTIRTGWHSRYNLNNRDFLAFKKNVLQGYHDRFFKFIKTHDLFHLNPQWLNARFNKDKNDFGVKPESWTNNDGTKAFSFNPNATNGQVFLYLLQNFVTLHKKKDKRNDLGNGKTLLTVDTKKGYALVFDEINKKLYHARVMDLPQRVVQSIFAELFPQYHKKGGVLKYYFGGDFNPESADSLISRLQAEHQAEQQAMIEKTGKTPQQYAAMHRNLQNGFTGVDKARGMAIAMDLASVLASVTGVGSAVGGGLGFAATLTELGADLADEGVSAGETAGNLMLGIGTSLLSFIPFVGGAGKAATLTGKAIKWTKNALKLVPTLAAAGVVFNSDIQQTLKKVSTYGVSGISEGKYDNHDLRNLATFIGAVTGLTRQGIISGKKAIIKNNAIRTEVQANKYYVKTKTGQLEIDKPTYDRLNSAKTVDEANAILNRTADNGVIGRGSRWTLGLGNKGVFDPKSNLSITKGSNTYSLSVNNMNDVGRFLYGDPSNPWSDARFTLNYLNRPAYSISWGFKTPGTTGTSSAVSTARSATSTGPMALSYRHFTPQNQKLIDLSRYRNPDGTLNATGQAVLNRVASGWESKQYKPDGLVRYMNRAYQYSPIKQPTGVVYMPNTNNPTTGRLFYWKEGGKTNFFEQGEINFPRIQNIVKNAQGGLIRKYELGGLHNIKATDKISWDKHIYGTNQYWDVLSLINPTNYQLYNELQNFGKKNLKNTQYTEYGDAVRSADVRKRRVGTNSEEKKKSWNTLASQINELLESYNTQENPLLINSGSDRKAYNWDDDWYGIQEYLRHLGRREFLDLNKIQEMKSHLDPNVKLGFDKDGWVQFYINGQKPEDIDDAEEWYSANPSGTSPTVETPQDTGSKPFIDPVDVTIDYGVKKDDKKDDKKSGIRYAIKKEDGTYEYIYDYTPEKYKLYKVAKEPLNKELENDKVEGQDFEWWKTYELTSIPYEEYIRGLLTANNETKLNPWFSHSLELGVEAANALGLGVTDWFNRKNRDLAKKMQFLLNHPKYHFSPVYQDNEAIQNAHNDFAKYMSMAKRMSGSDQLSNMANMSNAYVTGYDNIIKPAYKQSSDYWKSTVLNSIQNALFSSDSRIDTANSNNIQIQNKLTNDIHADLAYNTKQNSLMQNAITHASELMNTKKALYDQQYLQMVAWEAERTLEEAKQAAENDWLEYYASIEEKYKDDPTALANWNIYQKFKDSHWITYQNKLRIIEEEKKNYIMLHTNKLYGIPSLQLAEKFRYQKSKK